MHHILYDTQSSHFDISHATTTSSDKPPAAITSDILDKLMIVERQLICHPCVEYPGRVGHVPCKCAEESTVLTRGAREVMLCRFLT